MPKPRENELIRCSHFNWRLTKREDTWYADGRSNPINVGRHSLGTSDKDEALRQLSHLDRLRAVELGLIPHVPETSGYAKLLSLDEGRQLYKEYISRPRVTGGVRNSTVKRYRAVFDKFLPFAASRGVTVWNGVTAELLTAYAAHLEGKGYAHKTLVNELVTLKQAVKWMINAGHLRGVKPIDLKLRKAESERAYCWRPEEVRAMVERCRATAGLLWLAGVIIALACTGLRIAELVSLRWSDLDTATGRSRLTDETGCP